MVHLDSKESGRTFLLIVNCSYISILAKIFLTVSNLDKLYFNTGIDFTGWF